MSTLLTLGGITRRALSLFRNSNAFLQTISRQYDDSFAVTGAKIGATLRVRFPNDFTVRTGQTASAQALSEKSMTITVATQKGVDVSFASSELALSMDDFSERVLEPMVNVLAGAVASDCMTLVEQCPNIVHNVDGSNNTLSPTATTWLQAGAALDLVSAPRGNRKVIVDAQTQARTVASLTGLFNPTTEISKQYRVGAMTGTSGALGFDDWRMDQTCILHQTAAYSTLGTWTSVDATGQIFTTSALAGPLTAGDIITVAGAYAVNKVTKLTTGKLLQFVVTANVATSATTVNVYPPLISAAGAYQTVAAAPSGGAAIASPINAGEQYRKNFAFVPEAFTLVTADLEMPTGAVVDCARETYDGISLRMIRDFITTTDQFLTRLDILYGFAAPRPEWCCIIADVV
jgi:P22 coat protein - gene protein 5